jgi:hypothetical protein
MKKAVFTAAALVLAAGSRRASDRLATNDHSTPACPLPTIGILPMNTVRNLAVGVCALTAFVAVLAVPSRAGDFRSDPKFKEAMKNLGTIYRNLQEQDADWHHPSFGSKPDRVPIYSDDSGRSVWVDVQLGSLTQRMLVDTGASSLSIAKSIANDLLRRGEASLEDPSQFTIADGSTTPRA